MDKRGISEIVSYVLLIVIALAISVLVFALLKVYVPKEKPQCKEGINLIMEDVSCTYMPATTENILKVSLQNQGLFKVEKAFIRISKVTGRKSKEDVPPLNPISLVSSSGNTDGLNPSESTNALNFKLPSGFELPGEYILEVQPAHFTKGKDIESLALCPSITQIIDCKSS